MWRRDPQIDAMVRDWRAVLDALLELKDMVDPERVAWHGVSMGTAYGLPLLASEPQRIQCAVLGMWGVDYVNSRRLGEDAQAVRCPVLFQQKWDDAIFTREGQIDLFARLGDSRKWLKVYPGPHAVTDELMADAASFLSEHLASAQVHGESS